MLDDDTGTFQVDFQFSTWPKNRQWPQGTWQSDNIQSISFYNNNFTSGYWNNYKVYFKPEFTKLMKIKIAELGLFND
jgi:hypothetical protein